MRLPEAEVMLLALVRRQPDAFFTVAVDHRLRGVQRVVRPGIHALPLLDVRQALEDANGGLGAGGPARGGHGAAMSGAAASRLALPRAVAAARRTI